MHASRLGKISAVAVDTAESKKNVFPDSLKTLRKLTCAQVRRPEESGQQKKTF